MKITRIKAPKYKVCRYTLNEYEVRCMMSEVCQGLRDPAGIIIVDEDNNNAQILPDGRLTCNLKGFDISGNYTLILLRERRKKELKEEKEFLDNSYITTDDRGMEIRKMY